MYRFFAYRLKYLNVLVPTEQEVKYRVQVGILIIELYFIFAFAIFICL